MDKYDVHNSGECAKLIQMLTGLLGTQVVLLVHTEKAEAEGITIISNCCQHSTEKMIGTAYDCTVGSQGEEYEIVEPNQVLQTH